MKILHICTYDSGGAGKACVRLHQGLLELGIDSNLLVLHQSTRGIKRVYQYVELPPELDNYSKLKGKFKRILQEFKLYKIKDENDTSKFLKGRPEGLESFSFPNSPYDITKHSLYKEADIINLHWTSGFLDYSTFFNDKSKKIVWTLHDLNPFTGGCHYAETCTGFEMSCLHCPQLLNTSDDNISNWILKTKVNAIESGVSLTVVGVSNWILGESSKSLLFRNFKHVQIPYGINQNVFKPISRIVSREILGLPIDKKIVLFVSDALNTKRKGFSLLLKAIEKIKEQENIVLCAVGHTKMDEFDGKGLFTLGSISDERLMSVIYSAADVFVMPSLEDNFPNTVLEALMCGTPVIGFPVGGIKEMIQNNKNGYLCDSVSFDSLAKAIDSFLQSPTRFNQLEIRNLALSKYSLEIQATKYVELYNSLNHQMNSGFRSDLEPSGHKTVVSKILG